MRPFRSPLALSVALLAASAGCSSSDNGGPASVDAGADVAIRRIIDGATGDDGGTPAVFDGTSGQACRTNADCLGPDGGAGLNGCSINFAFDLAGVPNVQLSATPMCIVKPPTSGGNCDPAPSTDPNGDFVHFCDGPDAPTSPGLCVAGTSPPLPGQGTCLPKCTFAPDGSPAQGCLGKAVCQPITFTIGSQSNVITGYGICQGFCQTDADCSGLGTGFACQTDIGFCTKAKVTRAKQPGDTCSTAGSTLPCNCVTGVGSTTGYCATTCVVGGAPCPTGSVCDNGTPSPLDFGTGTTFPISQQNPGTQGFCAPVCSLPDAGAPADAGPAPDAGATADASADAAADAAPPATNDAGAPSASCPGTSTCQTSTVAGPDCQP
jgi:hypothetical protein